MKSRLRHAITVWAGLFVCASSAYAGVYLLGFTFARPLVILSVLAAFSLALAILLAMDADEQPSKGPENITFAGLAYILLVERKSLLALFVFVLVGIGTTAYYAFSALFSVESSESGIAIKLAFGRTDHYFPITSQDTWQNTGLRLKQDVEFSYSIVGRVSPGFLQNIESLNAHFRDLKAGKKPPRMAPVLDWPFTGPNGYSPKWYEGPEKLRAVTRHYKEDGGLTVKGVPHNKVVGILLEENEGIPRRADAGVPGYDIEQAATAGPIPFILDYPEYPNKMFRKKPNRDGILWVVINDADSYRGDNSGIFFLKIRTN